VIALRELMQGMTEVLSSIDPAWDVAWGLGEPVRDDLPARLVRMQIVTGPTAVMRDHGRAITVEAPATGELDVGDTSAADVAGAIIGHSLYREDFGAGADPTVVAASLAATITARSSTVTASAAGPVVELAEIEPGALFGLRPVGTAIWSPGDLALLSRTEGSHEVGIQIDAFAPPGVVGGNAWAMCSRILGLLESQAGSDALAQWGAGLASRGSAVDLSAVLASRYTSRVSTTVQVRAKLEHFTPVESITTVTHTIAEEP